MYFLSHPLTAARGVQITPALLAYTIILLSSAIGAFFTAQQVEGLDFFILVPLVALLMVWKMSLLSPSLQTGIGILTVVVAAILLFMVLDPDDASFAIQGKTIDEWNKFRAFVVALPCMCIILSIISLNPSKLNLILLGFPLVVCAGFSVYALRILLA